MPFLRREHQVWMFRRRVPGDIQERLGQREIYRSLETSSQRVARYRAALFFAASEELFAMARDGDLKPEELRAIARYWLDGQTVLKEKIDKLPPGELARFTPPEPLPRVTPFGYPQRPDEFRKRRKKIEDAHISNALSWAGYTPTPERVEAILPALKDAIIEYIEGRKTAVFYPERLAAQTGAVAPRPSPLFSEKIEDFISKKSETTEDRRGYSEQTQLQTRVTFALWLELMGDRPVRSYTLSEADQFRELLLSLPASHGKGAKVSAREAIAAAAPNAKRLSMKTAKRHFSTLRQYWLWLTPKEHVDKNIFVGHSFPGTKSSKKKRQPWSPEGLKRLFTCREWKTAAFESPEHWFPLLGLFSGLRLEEIARLRPTMDFSVENGIDCLLVQKQMAPWTPWDPKSEAGARSVPIHPFLIKHGLLKLVERRKSEDALRLFPGLVPSGPDEKLGTRYSRNFSKLKTSLGIDRLVVFHSFRHTFRTALESTPYKREWINAVLGHESEEKDVGDNYVHGVDIQCLNQIVRAFNPPLDLTPFVR